MISDDTAVLHDDTADDILCAMIQLLVLHDDTADDILCATR